MLFQVVIKKFVPKIRFQNVLGIKVFLFTKYPDERLLRFPAETVDFLKSEYLLAFVNPSPVTRDFFASDSFSSFAHRRTRICSCGGYSGNPSTQFLFV